MGPLSSLLILALGLSASAQVVTSGRNYTNLVPIGPDGDLYTGVVPNNWNGGGWYTTNAVAASVDPKEIVYTSDAPIFLTGALPDGVATTVPASLTNVTAPCTLTRSSESAKSSSTILTLTLPVNQPNCQFRANGYVPRFIIPATWLLPNPAPRDVNVKVTTTGNLPSGDGVNSTSRYTTVAQTIVPLTEISNGPIGPSGDQLLFGVQPNNFRAAPFTTTADAGTSLTGKYISYNSNTRPIFAPVLPAGAPTTVPVTLFQGATSPCTLTRVFFSTYSIELMLPDNNPNCVLKAGGVVQAFTFPQSWMLGNPSPSVVQVEITATNNPWGPSSVGYYSTTDLSQVTCANVNQYFVPGPVGQFSSLTDAKRATFAKALTTTTICDTPDWRLAMVLLPTTDQITVSMPGAETPIVVLNWGSVPPVARAVVTTYLPVANSFNILGLPMPSSNTVGSATIGLVSTTEGVVVGATNLVGSSVSSAVGVVGTTASGIPIVGGAASSATGAVGSVVSGATNLVGSTVSGATDLVTGTVASVTTLGNRRLLFVSNWDRSQIDGVLANGSPMEIRVHTPIPLGVVLMWNGAQWVSITESGTVTNQGNNNYLIRAPLRSAVVGYSALAIRVDKDSGSDDALFGLLALLAIPCLCCILLALALLLLLKRRKNKKACGGAQPSPCPFSQDMYMNPTFAPGPYALPMHGTPMYA